MGLPTRYAHPNICQEKPGTALVNALIAKTDKAHARAQSSTPYRIPDWLAAEQGWRL
jgi:hypothetical protein